MLRQPAFGLEDARRMIVGGEAKVRDLGQPMNISVADNGGNLGTDCHARSRTNRLVH